MFYDFCEINLYLKERDSKAMPRVFDRATSGSRYAKGRLVRKRRYVRQLEHIVVERSFSVHYWRSLRTKFIVEYR